MVINFGTDGWRAIIADQFTFENVAICTNATLDYLKQNDNQKSANSEFPNCH